MKRGMTVCATLAIIAVAAFAGSAKENEDHHGKAHEQESYTIGLFGDMPYNALGKSQYPALLADINQAHVEFSVHDGDLKAGGDGPCADSLYHLLGTVRHSDAAIL